MNGPSVPGGCVPTAELLPELSLGILGGAERAEVLAHLDRCARCREDSATWAATADALPTVLPEAEPPAGFETRALARLRADRTRVPRRPLLRRVLGVAAIVAAVMIVTLAAVRIIDATGDGSGDPVVATEMTSAPMIGKSGHPAGDAFLTAGDDRYVFVDVDYGDGTGKYEIEAVDGSNDVTSVGWVTVKEGHGAWAGELPAGAGDPAMLRMVGVDGEVFCWARFGPVAS